MGGGQDIWNPDIDLGNNSEVQDKNFDFMLGEMQTGSKKSGASGRSLFAGLGSLVGGAGKTSSSSFVSVNPTNILTADTSTASTVKL